MTEHPLSKDKEDPAPVQGNRATADVLGLPLGMLILAIFAIATWNPLVIKPLINALILLYKSTGNLGTSILILGIALNVLFLILGAPALQMEQNMWEQDTRQRGWRRKASKGSSAPSRLWGIGIRNGILHGLPGLASVAMIWIFWKVFSPPSEAPANLNIFLWPSLDPLQGSVHADFLHLDLRENDLQQVSWLPYPLPGVLVWASTIFSFLYAHLRETIKKRYAIPQLSRRISGCVLWAGPLLTFIASLLFPSGVLLFWLTGQPFSLLKLWLFPLAIIND